MADRRNVYDEKKICGDYGADACGCDCCFRLRQKEAETQTPQTETQIKIESETQTETETETETEFVVPEGKAISHLTGEIVDEAVNNRRPVALMNQ